MIFVNVAKKAHKACIMTYTSYPCFPRVREMVHKCREEGEIETKKMSGKGEIGLKYVGRREKVAQKLAEEKDLPYCPSPYTEREK